MAFSGGQGKDATQERRVRLESASYYWTILSWGTKWLDWPRQAGQHTKFSRYLKIHRCLLRSIMSELATWWIHTPDQNGQHIAYSYYWQLYSVYTSMTVPIGSLLFELAIQLASMLTSVDISATIYIASCLWHTATSKQLSGQKKQDLILIVKVLFVLGNFVFIWERDSKFCFVFCNILSFGCWDKQISSFERH